MKIKRFTEEVLDEFKFRANSHQTHFEDLVLLGRDGLEELNDKIDKFIRRLESNTNELNMTTKIDGAPAVACWSKFEGYPDNSICLKSFLISNKNCLSSVDDIENKYGDRPDMATKLKYCLEIAKYIPSGQAWQGDCLYSSNDLREVEIDGTKYLTFHPNKIVYAFSEDNPTYETIKNSDFGICFHTIYTGNLEHKSQSFNIDVSVLQGIPNNIYIMSPALDIPTEKSEYSLDKVLELYGQLKQVEDKLNSDPAYEELVNNSAFMGYWNTFENANLSDKQAVNLNTDTLIDDLRDYIRDKKQKEFNKKEFKTDAGREKATNKLQSDLIELDSLLNDKKVVLYNMVNGLNLAANIKMLLWSGLKKSKQNYNTYYLHKDRGYIPASMEGVALSDQDGNIVKIVDRSSFSNVNRDSNYLSGFEH